MNRLEEVLDTLLANVPDSAMAAVVGLDGLPIASVKRGGPIDPERAAAEFTGAVRSIARASSRSQAGQPGSVAVSTDRAHGLVRMLGSDFYLLLLTGPEANDTRATAEIDRVLPALEAVLHRQGSPPPSAGRPRLRRSTTLPFLILVVAGLAVGLVWLGVHRRNGASGVGGATATSTSHASGIGLPAAGQAASTPSGTPAAPPSAAASPEQVAARPVPPGPSTSDVAYFPQTGHHLSGVFKTYWEQHGGLAQFGYPITEEFQERDPPPPAGDGQVHTVQYFERARFEYHPEFTGTPYEVELGLLGSEVATPRRATPPFQPVAPIADTAGQRYFAATGHTLREPFLSYWEQHGGLAVYGYPISEPFVENGFTVQYFQRERFEYHPEFVNTPYSVLLGLLGREVLASNPPPSP